MFGGITRNGDGRITAAASIMLTYYLVDGDPGLDGAAGGQARNQTPGQVATFPARLRRPLPHLITCPAPPHHHISPLPTIAHQRDLFGDRTVVEPTIRQLFATA